MKFSSLFQSDKSSPSSSQSNSPIPPPNNTLNSISIIPQIAPLQNFNSKFSISTELDETSCPVCNESLSLRLKGEQIVTPTCNHSLHEACFEAVYGGLIRARQGGSCGICGICSRDMRIGEEGTEISGRKNKFAAISGLPLTEEIILPRSQSSRRTHFDNNNNNFENLLEDDDLVELDSLRLPFSLDRSRKASAETMKGSLSNSIRISGSSSTGSSSSLEVVKPIISVRSEYSTITRSSIRDEKQHLTCLVSIEIPRRYPRAGKEREWNSNEIVKENELNQMIGNRTSTTTTNHSNSTYSGNYSGPPTSASPTSSSFSSPSYYRFGSASAPSSPVVKDPLTITMEDLYSRMEDWKGHSPQEFGPLRLCDYIHVRKENNVREFLVYLFEEAILCVTDDKRKEDVKGKENLRLKGRIFVRHVRKVVDTSKLGELSITVYMNDENLDEFIMTFQEKSRLDIWKSSIENLIKLHHLPPADRSIANKQQSTSMAVSTSMTGTLSGDSSHSNHSDFSNNSDAGGFGRSPSHASSVSSYTKSSQFKSFDIPEEDNIKNEMQYLNLASQSSTNNNFSKTSPVEYSLPLPTISPHLPNPKDFTPLDLMLILSLPSPTSTSFSLKLKILKSSLRFISQTVGPRTRISLITFHTGDGTKGRLSKTPLISVGTNDGMKRFEDLIEEIGIEEGGVFDQGESSVNIAVAMNLALDIILQRKTKSALTGIILMNDSMKDTTQKIQLDLVLARIESIKVPIHTIGWGNHDSSSLLLLSNQTSGTYTYVSEYYQLQSVFAGILGSFLSLAINHLKVHISIPEKKWFKIRKVSGGTSQSNLTILSSDGADVDLEIGEMRFGERKDILIEIEMNLSSFGDNNHSRNRIGRSGTGNQVEDSPTTTATDAFFLAKVGINPSNLNDDYRTSTSNFYEDEYDCLPDLVPLYEVNASYRDPAAGKSISRLNPTPTLLTIIVQPPTTNSDKTISRSNSNSQSPASSTSNPEIVQRRMELLCSDMLTRTLLLMSRRNDSQARKLLSETLRIINTINSSLRPHSSLQELSAYNTLLALSEDISIILDGISNRSTSFSTSIRSVCAQLIVVLRDQKSWTNRSAIERLYFKSELIFWTLEKSNAFIM